MTIVAAWMSALTGVGPSIASGSQTWSGNWALLGVVDNGDPVSKNTLVSFELVYSQANQPLPMPVFAASSGGGVVPFRDGETIYAALFAVIPRALWPDKPVVAGIMPISNLGQVTRMAHMSGAEVPPFVVALIGSLLTAIPLSPAGLGFAQAGVIGVLTVAYGIPLPEATAITILDWVISVLSIIVFGAVTYVVSPMPRGMGHIQQPSTPSSAATPV